jgi:hypothetical protein
MMCAMDDLEEVPHAPVGIGIDGLVGALKEYGCIIIDSLIQPEALESIHNELKSIAAEAPFGDNELDGYATRRVFDPFSRTRVLDDLVLNPLLLGTIEAMIGPAQFGMTLLSDIKPGEVAQRLHRDSSVYPIPIDFGPVEINTIWAIDDFNRTNGATVLSPGSHVRDIRPSDYSSVALATATMSAGSVLLYDGRLIHGAGRNRSSMTRLALIIEHVVRWLRPAENHTLAVPPSIAATLAEPLQELLGYNQHNSFLGHVAGLPPKAWLNTQA